MESGWHCFRSGPVDDDRLCQKAALWDLRPAGQRPGNEVTGMVLRTRTGVRPVFVSVGQLIDLSTAERVILTCTYHSHLPEPL